MRMLKCECFDSGCKSHVGVKGCTKMACDILYRIDMDDRTGTAMCSECAEDAMESGLFETNDDWIDREYQAQYAYACGYFD